MGIRIALWEIGGKFFVKHPIFGTGFGGESEALREQVKVDSYNPEVTDALMELSKTHFHNNYVQVAVGLGTIGFILYLYILYQILILKIKSKELSNLRYIFLSVYSISSMVEMMFGPQFPLAFFALFVGLFIGFSKNDDDYVFEKLRKV